MILAADYRAKAENCERLAREAQDDYHRKNFEKLAVMWSEMADKAEGRSALARELDPLEQVQLDDALATIKNADTTR